jgi:hypothetical protein
MLAFSPFTGAMSSQAGFSRAPVLAIAIDTSLSVHFNEFSRYLVDYLARGASLSTITKSPDTLSMRPRRDAQCTLERPPEAGTAHQPTNRGAQNRCLRRAHAPQDGRRYAPHRRIAHRARSGSRARQCRFSPPATTCTRSETRRAKSSRRCPSPAFRTSLRTSTTSSPAAILTCARTPTCVRPAPVYARASAHRAPRRVQESSSRADYAQLLRRVFDLAPPEQVALPALRQPAPDRQVRASKTPYGGVNDARNAHNPLWPVDVAPGPNSLRIHQPSEALLLGSRSGETAGIIVETSPRSAFLARTAVVGHLLDVLLEELQRGVRDGSEGSIQAASDVLDRVRTHSPAPVSGSIS